MNDVAKRILSILTERFKHKGANNFNLSEELNICDPVSDRQMTEAEKLYVKKELLVIIQYKESHDHAVLVPVSMVTDPKGHEEWYEKWFIENNDIEKSYYWKRLESYLSHVLSQKYTPQNAGKVVKSIDEATYKIMRNLANPSRPEFSYKGLVVGYVQSGKTANFTALIAKAADAGYKLIIVLAGIHNGLRRQTQVRLDRELTGMKDIDDTDDYISLPGPAKMWFRLTTARNDFSTDNLGLFSVVCNIDTPKIAVVKKNSGVLNRLIEYVSNASLACRASVPVLIIDDEADQASIDTNATSSDTDPSRINECIRNLLSLFPKKAYIGYTATPFANVLIDMTAEHDSLDDDLYPRNFIVSLPEPEGYFGSSMIFNGQLADRFVQEIPDEASTLLQEAEMTVNLSNAIDQFVICCAVRNLRGDKKKPMSMLVHVSHRIREMTIINEIITRYIETIKGRYESSIFKQALKVQYINIWQDIQEDACVINEMLSLENYIPEFEQIWNEVPNVLYVLQILELNSASDNSLDYTTGDEIKVIAVGGNQLSRGLTLEGLMTSYYLRASRQYDTLLQMGRWFGYRKGYEDLTRIHTTEQIWLFFEHLALVEEELRSEIYRYEEEGKTPAQLAVAIRSHRNLSVTASNKMGAARLRQNSYSDSLNQTIWFPLDQPEILRSNYKLGESFINKINLTVGFSNINNSGIYLANKKIGYGIVLKDFLNKYTFVDKGRTGGPGLDSESLLAYINRRINDKNSELNEWSVALVGNVNPVPGDITVNYGGLNINRIQRSRKHTEKGYNVGVLTEPSHLRVDLKGEFERSSQNPLLLLYIIWKDSRAKGDSIPDNLLSFNQRIDLYRFVKTEKIDVLGLAIVLPKSHFEPNSYIGQ